MNTNIKKNIEKLNDKKSTKLQWIKKLDRSNKIAIVAIVLAFVYYLGAYIISNQSIIKKYASEVLDNNITIKTTKFEDKNNDIIIFNDKTFIQKNKELDKVVKILFGENYDEFLIEQKQNNTELMTELKLLLTNKNAYITIELLTEKIKKRDGLFKKIDSIHNEEIKLESKKALRTFEYKKYHSILQNYSEALSGTNLEESGEIYFLRAEEFNSRFKYQKAIDLYTRATKINEYKSLYFNNLGVAYNNIGKKNKAIKYFEIALKIDLQMLGKNSPIIGNRYNNIARAYYNINNYNKAIGYFEKAIKIIGEDNFNISSDYNNIGKIYNEVNSYDKAIEYFNKALAIDLNKVGENHHIIALNYNNLGTSYSNKEDYNKAIEYFKKALKIDINTLGKNNLNTVKDYNNIAGAYYNMKYNNKAIEYFKKAINISLNLTDVIDPFIADKYNNIGLVYRDKGNNTNAIEFIEKSLNINLINKNNANIATNYHSLGSVYNNKENYNKAIEYFNKALIIDLEIDKNNKSVKNGDMAISRDYNSLGDIYIKKGDRNKAIWYYQKALKSI